MTAVVNTLTTPHHHFFKTFAGDTSEFDVSLMNGLAGAALVSGYLGRALTNNTGADAGARFGKLSRVLQEQLITRLREGNLKIRSLNSLCSGLAGVVYALDQLKLEGFSDHTLERETRDSLTEIMLERTLENFAERNTDYLHGPLGVFFVLLSDQESPVSNRALDQIFAKYQEQLITDDRGSRIYNSVLEGQREADEFNFGLAHGMPGHVALWTEAYSKGYRPDATKKLVANLIKYIDQYRIAPGELPQEGSHKFYPKSVIENDASAWEEHKAETYNSRLGWCYGDLNIAFAKLKAGKVFNREDWYQEGLEVALHCATRLDPQDAQINKNAYFCHGAAGLVYMFGLLYEATGEAAFLTAKDYFADYYRELWRSPHYVDLKLYRPTSFLDGLPGAVLGTLSEVPGGGYPLSAALLLNI